MLDSWELNYFRSLEQILPDWDADGLSNFEEYIAGTDPYNSNDFLQIESMVLADETNNNVQLNLWLGKNRTYYILSSDSADATKTTNATIAATSSWGAAYWVDTNAVIETAQRYYTIRTDFGGGYCPTQDVQTF